MPSATYIGISWGAGCGPRRCGGRRWWPCSRPWTSRSTRRSAASNSSRVAFSREPLGRTRRSTGVEGRASAPGYRNPIADEAPGRALPGGYSSARRAISTATTAASSPTLWPAGPSERARAWSSSSVVRTPKATGTPVASWTCWMPGRRLPRHELVVGGLAADHAAEADDGVDAPGRGQDAGAHRQLEAARHARLDDVGLGHAEVGQPAADALERAGRRCARSTGRGRRRPAGRVPSRPSGRSRPCRCAGHHGASSEALEEVAHALALGAQVGDVLGVDAPRPTGPAR